MLRRASNNIDRRLEKIRDRLERLPADAHSKFVATTPIDTGRARRSTDLRNTSIVADYDYAVRLNTGYSRQAPGGMTDPTIEYIRDQIRKM
jgi:hypothetical protein